MNEQAKTELMMQSLSEGFSLICGEHKTVKRLERKPFSGSSSFATERIRALFDGDEWVDIFFKDLNPENLLEEALVIREAGLERSRRELLMYQNILMPLQLNTPQLYGSRWDPDEGFYWIFLEDAGPKRLSRLGDFSLWVDATRWAARLHALDPGEIYDKAGFLSRHEPEHFALCARRLEEGLSRFNTQQKRLITKALSHYCNITDYLISLPQHLIHGEYFGKNVMIRPGDPHKTIAVIDWETAAFGPRCTDLVSITAGRWTSEQREIMYAAYAGQYELEIGHSVDLEALMQEIECVALYRALWWLGYWSEGDEAHITRWMRELEVVVNRRGE